MSSPHTTDDFVRRLAKLVDGLLTEKYGRRIGFALLLYEFDSVGAGSYICNGEREDMIKVLRETAEALEQNADIPPTIGEA